MEEFYRIYISIQKFADDSVRSEKMMVEQGYKSDVLLGIFIGGATAASNISSVLDFTKFLIRLLQLKENHMDQASASNRLASRCITWRRL